MAFAVGPITQVAVGSTTSSLTSPAASGGTGPYTYQWYRSTTSGFTPGAGNIIAGATALALSDTGLIPNTKYYYEIVATDTGNGNVTVGSAQLGVVTAVPAISQNTFAPLPFLGMIDQAVSPNTLTCLLDPGVVGPVYAGCAVKRANPTVPNPPGYNGPINVIPCTADTDDVFGFIQYSMRDVFFSGGMPVEVASKLDVIYLYATASGNVTDACVLDLTTNGGVTPVGTSGQRVVGRWLDQPFIGQLTRVSLDVPTTQVVA